MPSLFLHASLDAYFRLTSLFSLLMPPRCRRCRPCRRFARFFRRLIADMTMLMSTTTILLMIFVYLFFFSFTFHADHFHHFSIDHFITFFAAYFFIS